MNHSKFDKLGTEVVAYGNLSHFGFYLSLPTAFGADIQCLH